MGKFNDFCFRRNTKCRFGNETEGQRGSVKKKNKKKKTRKKKTKTKAKTKTNKQKTSKTKTQKKLVNSGYKITFHSNVLPLKHLAEKRTK